MLRAMPRKITTRIDPATLNGLHLLIWEHDHTTNDVEKVRAARKVSDSFRNAGGCGWCWSETHDHHECTLIVVRPDDNQH